MKRLLTLVAALGLLGAGLLVISAPASATARHVGVVVRYANGHVSAGCVLVGGTGLQLLERHHKVQLGTQQYTGFVIKVDGVGAARPDDTHYWSYWHSGGNGSWHYSSSGAASYRPKAGTVEGWSYVNGQSSAPRPPSRTYAALCGRLDPHAAPRSTTSSGSPAATTAAPTTEAAPAVTPTSQPAPRTTAPLVTRSRAAGTAAAPAQRTTAAIARTTPSRTAAEKARSHRRAHHAATPTSSVSAHSRAQRSTPGTSSPSSIAAEPAADTSGTNAWPTVGALAVVAALALTAWIVMRRRAG